MYDPPFTINSRIENIVSDISSSLESMKIPIESRNANRIKAIHTSLAIEGNSLTE